MAPRPARPRRRTTAALAGITVALTMAGCGEGDPKPGPEVAGGNAGVDQRVDEDIKVLDVKLEYPLAGRYTQGDDARLFLAISNTGNAPDSLLAVSGPDFANAEATGGFPIVVAPNNTAYVGAQNQPAITLSDLARPLGPSQSIPVTFRFQNAGPVTVQAVVAAEGQTPGPTYSFPDPAEDPSATG